MGPNHKDGCNGLSFRYSGVGYNRVKVCKCGAEDHAPSLNTGPQAWNVYLRGRLIDTIFCNLDMNMWDVKNALIFHDGYDLGIVVRRA